MSDRSIGRALVIGAGVAGLTTALSLKERGISPIVVAENFAPDLTSVVAGALWEWPPAVCGYHHDEISLDRSKRWCMSSYRKFETLLSDPSNGVSIRPVTFYFRNRIEENAFHHVKMKEIEQVVPGFLRDAELIKRNGINQNIGLIDAYQHLAPMVDTDAYMRWLRQKCRESGIFLLRRKLTGLLVDQEDQLKREFDVQVIVNCAGLGSRELAGEYMYPLRGALIRLVNDGEFIPRLTEAHCVSHDNVTGVDEIVFIVPRGKDRIVLGALAEADQWNKDIDLTNHEPIRRMYDRCIEFLPGLKNARLDPVEPVRVGLRPFRRNNVRVDAVEGTSIIHNYGHGGAGVTLSWGCAAEAADYARVLLDGMPVDADDGDARKMVA